jgi:hypothetical protein
LTADKEQASVNRKERRDAERKRRKCKDLLSYKKEDPLEGLFKLKRPMPGQEP